MSIKQAERKKQSKALWPVLGFFMIVALGVIAWTLAPGLISWLAVNMRGFNGNELRPFWKMQLAFAAVIFVVLGAIVALLVAITVPRTKSRTQDAQVKEDREKLVKTITEKKKARRRLARDMSRMDRE
jgi:biotin transporter BioY